MLQPLEMCSYDSALSPDTWVYQGGTAINWKEGGVHGTPITDKKSTRVALAKSFSTAS
jgi:hypothetical protein